MSVAGDILTDVLSKLSTQLGATFREMPDLFSVENLSSRELENTYAAILLDGSNDENQNTSFITFTRNLEIKISYRSYSRVASGANAKTKLATLFTNEEALITYFLAWPSKPTGLVAVIDPVKTKVEPKTIGDDSYLINTINLNIMYRYAS